MPRRWEDGLTDADRPSHADRLRDSITRLREDVEARSDPLLDEIADALELLLSLTRHTHDHTMENQQLIRALASRCEQHPHPPATAPRTPPG